MDEKIQEIALSVEGLLFRAHLDYRYICAFALAGKKLREEGSSEKRANFSRPVNIWFSHIRELLKVDMANCIWKATCDTHKNSTTLNELHKAITSGENENKEFFPPLSYPCDEYKDDISALRNKFFSHSDKQGTKRRISVEEMKTLLDELTGVYNGMVEENHWQHPLSQVSESEIRYTVHDIDEVISNMVEQNVAWYPINTPDEEKQSN